MLPIKFRVNWSFCKGEIDFQDGEYDSNLRISIGTILDIFHLQVIPILQVSFNLVSVKG